MRVEKLCMPKILMVEIDPILKWQCKSYTPLPPPPPPPTKKKLISQLKLTLVASKRLQAYKLAVQINLKFISKIFSVFLCVQLVHF